MLAERVDEGGLLLADEVQVELVPALLDVLLQPRGVLVQVAGDAYDCATCSGVTVLADDVEGLDRLGVPADRWAEDVAAPLVVRDRERPRLRSAPS